MIVSSLEKNCAHLKNSDLILCPYSTIHKYISHWSNYSRDKSINLFIFLSERVLQFNEVVRLTSVQLIYSISKSKYVSFSNKIKRSIYQGELYVRRLSGYSSLSINYRIL